MSCPAARRIHAPHAKPEPNDTSTTVSRPDYCRLRLRRGYRFRCGGLSWAVEEAEARADAKIIWRRERDSNPRYGFPYTHFPGVRLQPLGHLSVAPVMTASARFCKQADPFPLTFLRNSEIFQGDGPKTAPAAAFNAGRCWPATATMRCRASTSPARPVTRPPRRGHCHGCFPT